MKSKRGHKGLGIACLLVVFLLLKIILTVFSASFKESLLSFPCKGQTAVAAEATGADPQKVATESSAKPPVTGPQKGLDARRADTDTEERSGLDAERRRIKREREELEALRTEIDGKLSELSSLQDKIQQVVAEKNAARAKKIKHLIKVYISMSPKKAAALIEKLDIDVIVEVFASMKGDAAGKILSYVNSAKAALISERLLKR